MLKSAVTVAAMTATSQRKFLVVADDTPEFQAALRFACRRARSTGGHVALLRVIEPEYFEHWSGVREEIERQAREEAEAIAADRRPRWSRPRPACRPNS